MRHDLRKVRLSVENGSADVKLIDKYMIFLRIRREEYDVSFTFNFDETGLFYAIFTWKSYVCKRGDNNCKGD